MIAVSGDGAAFFDAIRDDADFSGTYGGPNDWPYYLIGCYPPSGGTTIELFASAQAAIPSVYDKIPSGTHGGGDAITVSGNFAMKGAMDRDWETTN